MRDVEQFKIDLARVFYLCLTILAMGALVCARTSRASDSIEDFLDYLYVPGQWALYLRQVASTEHTPGHGILMLATKKGFKLFAHSSLRATTYRAQVYARIHSVSDNSPHFVVISIEYGIGKARSVTLYVSPEPVGFPPQLLLNFKGISYFDWSQPK